MSHGYNMVLTLHELSRNAVSFDSVTIRCGDGCGSPFVTYMDDLYGVTGQCEKVLHEVGSELTL